MPASGTVIIGTTLIEYEFPFEKAEWAAFEVLGMPERYRGYARRLEGSAEPDAPTTFGDEHEAVATYLAYHHEKWHLRHVLSTHFGWAHYSFRSFRYVAGELILKAWAGSDQAGFGEPAQLPVPALEFAVTRGLRPACESWNNSFVLEKFLSGDFRAQGVDESTQARVTHALTELAMTSCQFLGGCPTPALYERKGVVAAVGRSLRWFGWSPESGIPRVTWGIPHLPDSVELANMSGTAVVEGLARACEVISLLQINASSKVMSRYKWTHWFEPYSTIFLAVERELGLEGLGALQVAAFLADWALQAPLITSLAGHSTVDIEELHPGLRFGILLDQMRRMKARGEAIGAVVDAPSALQAEVSATLGWTSPEELSERTSRLKNLGRAPLTRHMAGALIEGSALRRSAPSEFRWPTTTKEVGFLEPVFVFFSDCFRPSGGYGEQFAGDGGMFLHTHVGEAYMDALLVSGDFTRARRLTTALACTLGQSLPDAPSVGQLAHRFLRGAGLPDAMVVRMVARHFADHGGGE